MHAVGVDVPGKNNKISRTLSSARNIERVSVVIFEQNRHIGVWPDVCGRATIIIM